MGTIVLRRLFSRKGEIKSIKSLIKPFIEGLIKSIILSQYDPGCAKHWEKNPEAMLKKAKGINYSGLELFLSLVDDYKDIRIDNDLRDIISDIRDNKSADEFIMDILTRMKKEFSYDGNKYSSIIDRMLRDKGEESFIKEFRAKVKYLTLLLTEQIGENEELEWWDNRIADMKVDWRKSNIDYSKFSDFIKKIK